MNKQNYLYLYLNYLKIKQLKPHYSVRKHTVDSDKTNVVPVFIKEDTNGNFHI